MEVKNFWKKSTNLSWTTYFSRSQQILEKVKKSDGKSACFKKVNKSVIQAPSLSQATNLYKKSTNFRKSQQIWRKGNRFESDNIFDEKSTNFGESQQILEKVNKSEGKSTNWSKFNMQQVNKFYGYTRVTRNNWLLRWCSTILPAKQLHHM